MGGRFECVRSDKRRNVIAVKEMEDDIRVLFWLKHSCTLNNLKKKNTLCNESQEDLCVFSLTKLIVLQMQSCKFNWLIVFVVHS